MLRSGVIFHTYASVHNKLEKALGQPIQVYIPRWRPQRRAGMVGNTVILDEKSTKMMENHLAISAKEFIW